MNPMTSIAGGAMLLAATIAAPGLARADRDAVTWQVQRLGDNFDVVWTNREPGMPHGGGVARMAGGGDDSAILYADTPYLMQAPAEFRLSGGGEDMRVIGIPAPGSGTTFSDLPGITGQAG